MKKILAILLALIALFAFASCGATKNEAAKTDAEYVVEKGTLVVGITEFEPMDYNDSEGNWIGFDADMASAFAEYLGVKVEFQVINWDFKVNELDSKTIDCVWNGMTLTDDVKTAMSCSNPYCNNAQVVVVKKAVADQYNSVEAVKELNFAVEVGSAGKDMAVENSFKFTEVEDQAAAVNEVQAGTADAAIIDKLMAGAMVGEGTGFTELCYTIDLNAEQYGVGFRKGSDLTAKLNDFFKTTYESGKMLEIAKTYGVQEALIEQ